MATQRILLLGVASILCLAAAGQEKEDTREINLARLASAQTGSVIPTSAFLGKNETKVSRNEAAFRYRGEDGELAYRWHAPRKAADPVFGTFTVRAKPAGKPSKWSKDVPFAGKARLEWTEEAQWLDRTFTKTPTGALCSVRYRVGQSDATLQIKVVIQDKSLSIEIGVDRPVVKVFNAGGWEAPGARTVTVPYYSGAPVYLPAQNLFANAFLDWTSAQATSHTLAQAIYEPLTDGSRLTVQERVVFTASWNFDEVLPNIPNPASEYRSKVAGRMVLDIWEGRFDEIAKKFAEYAGYGIRDCIALIHVWQRSGYDNALPSHYPAQQKLGGEQALKQAVTAGEQNGCYVALHENYVDYYPNYIGFDENDIAKTSARERLKAWYNPSTSIQSFAVKPSRMVALANTQSPEIHKRYGTNASFLDVNSSVSPWFHQDMQEGIAGAGTFRSFGEESKKLWEFERQTHGGPVFGEGGHHWFWSGLLDGVEAQPGQGWPLHEGHTMPLFVDFDLLKIHPLQVNHGMGYYERWARSAEDATTLEAMDQYRMQEVAYGHAPFLGRATWTQLPIAWLESHLVTPVATRYGAAHATSIRYQVDGEWVDTNSAVRANQFERVQVQYDNGLTIVANSSSSELRWNQLVLPRFGWAATGAGLTAFTAVRDGVIMDFAETEDSLFANARNSQDWKTDSAVEASARLNSSAKIIDFGPVRTDGSVFLSRDGAEWTMRVFPQDRTFTVELNEERFPKPASVTAEGSPSTTIQPEPHEKWWRLPLNGAKVYRWRAEK